MQHPEETEAGSLVAKPRTCPGCGRVFVPLTEWYALTRCYRCLVNLEQAAAGREIHRPAKAKDWRLPARGNPR